MTLVAASENGAWIVCEEALKAAASDPNYFESGKECGTGPYTLKSYSSGKQVVLAQNKDYWGGWKSNQFKNVVFQITPEAIVQQQALQSGQVDVATSVPVENIAKLARNSKFKVTRDSSSLNYRLLQRDPSAARRRARALGALVRDPVQGHLTSARGVRQRSPAARPAGHLPVQRVDTPVRRRISAKAKALLTRPGIPRAAGSPRSHVRRREPAEARFAPLIKDAFEKIGVTVNVTSMLFNQQWKVRPRGPGKGSGHLPAALLADLLGRGLGQPVVAVPLEQQPRSSTSATGRSPLYDSLIDGAGDEVARRRTGSRRERCTGRRLHHAVAEGNQARRLFTLTT